MRRFVVGLAFVLTMLAVPTWAFAGDQEIANELVKQLQAKKQSGELKRFGIDLEIDHGVVWLKGHVTSPDQRDLVLGIAKNIDGVEEVVDDIAVRTAKTTSKKRERRKSLLPIDIAKKSAAKLAGLNQEAKPIRETAAIPAPPATQVEPVEQVVSQPIPSQPQSHHLHDHAATPVQASRLSDDEIAQAVIARLREQQHSGALRDFTLDVTVETGSVWIKGSVASPQQQHLVLEVARRVRGVTQVVNDINVHQVALATQPVHAPPISNVDSRLRSATVHQAAPARPQGRQMPVAFAPAAGAQPVAMNAASGVARARYDHPTMPGYAWPSYAAYPNYGAVTYPKQYSPAAWPYIGPFYPYPQVPLGWRKVTLQWDDGWWFLDFKSK